MGDTATAASPYPRDGYTPEWLALEDAMGGRFFMKGDLDTEVAAFDNNFTALAKLWPELPEKLEITEETISDEPGWGPMRARIYKPESDAPLPLMIYFHGGGFFCGNLQTEEWHCGYFAVKTPCVVMSIDYPLYPKATTEPILTAGIKSVEWAQANASKYNADASRTLLCGGSAGAWMSVMLTYQLHQLEGKKLFAGLILLYPATAHWDYNGKYKDQYRAWDENGTNSVPIISTALAQRMWPQQGFDFTSPIHFPLLADDVSKYPPCYLVAAEKDCLRDDATCFDKFLTDCGVKTKLDYYPGLPHWFHFFPQLPIAHEMLAKCIDGVKFVLAAHAG